MIEGLVQYLVEETLKFDSRNFQVLEQVRTSLNTSNYNELKESVKIFRAHIFLLNNIEFIKSFMSSLNLNDFFLKINPKFESIMAKNMFINIENACSVFNYLRKKWLKLIQPNKPKKYGPSYKLMDLQNNLRRRSMFVFSENLDQKGDEKFVLNELKEIEHDEANNTEIIPFHQAKSKTKEAFIIILKEILLICTQTLIQDLHVNNTIRGKATKILRPILESVFESGRQADIVQFLDIIHVTEDHNQMINVIFERMFPLNSNILVQ